MLAGFSAVLHGFSLAGVTSLASGALMVVMIIGCLNCARRLWLRGTLRDWSLVAIMNLAMITLHLPAPGHHHGAVGTAVAVPHSTVMTMATALAATEVVLAAAVVCHRTRVDPRRAALLAGHTGSGPAEVVTSSRAQTFSDRAVRALAVLAVLAMVAIPTAGNLAADPGATDVITVAAVGRNGQAADGYHVEPRFSSPELSGCTAPSPAAVGDNIYACDPGSAAAEVCWPAPASLLCAVDPWGKSLRRFHSPGTLPAVAPPATPMPFALVLDDGTRCILPNGVDLGGRADGTVPIYGCGHNKLSLGVLAPPDWDPASAIDRSQPLWAVYVGQLGPPTTPFQPPIRHTVTTAWFAGNTG